MYPRESTLSKLIDHQRSWGDVLNKIEDQNFEVGDRVVATIARVGRVQFEMAATIGDAIASLDHRFEEMEREKSIQQAVQLDLLRRIEFSLFALILIGCSIAYGVLK